MDEISLQVNGIETARPEFELMPTALCPGASMRCGGQNAPELIRKQFDSPVPARQHQLTPHSRGTLHAERPFTESTSFTVFGSETRNLSPSYHMGGSPLPMLFGVGNQP
jgi:hypothetical protein